MADLKSALAREPAAQFWLGCLVGSIVRGGPSREENARRFIEAFRELEKRLSHDEVMQVDANINALVAEARLAIERGEITLVTDSDWNQRSNEIATGLIN